MEIIDITRHNKCTLNIKKLKYDEYLINIIHFFLSLSEQSYYI